MKKQDVVKLILESRFGISPKFRNARAFAPSNIALCKYWGKRDDELHLPVTSSLSISLPNKGSNTELMISNQNQVILNGNLMPPDESFSTKIFDFNSLFDPTKELKLLINIECNIPIEAGFASSASGFAALVIALNKLYDWNLAHKELSILARLGSGSSSRSIWPKGFVIWYKGELPNGMDSYAEQLPYSWSELGVGLIHISDQKKIVPSRTAMRITRDTSPLYGQWTKIVKDNIIQIISAIEHKDFYSFGHLVESNSQFMHSMMKTSNPSINYDNDQSIAIKKKIRFLRQNLQFPVFFTQDAGPNLVIFFLKENIRSRENFFKELSSPSCELEELY